MNQFKSELGIRTVGFDLLCDLIQSKSGIVIDDSRKSYLVDRFGERVIENGFDSYLEYYYLLNYDQGGIKEWDEVMDIVTVNETYFWREQIQIRCLFEQIIPVFFSNQIIKIWSAACSSGEEPYSIIMEMLERNLLLKGVRVYATDASNRIIDKAHKGVYRDWSFRSLPHEIRDKYFRKTNEIEWAIDEMIKSQVNFRTVNLLNFDELKEYANANVIFCRNVFIYFPDHIIEKILNQMFQSMPTPSFLFVGIAESLMRLNTHFEIREIGNVFVYCKT